ncbi:Rossmann-like and DUF2520 domain-containing protein [Zhouia amylolytica]|uniref:Rossmann-like and DUF2520 domain-containing protein n=1 Tax=Zhouia amylolytica TaxID=376730 RepID=UPI0020CD41F3|nr:DUF2520 domain-containing protein [Zhouia amylolytica]MCQ0112181.1 DUF2520 domain-containing protein [Zhouia amylolytica]
MTTVALIGAGNLATHLYKAFRNTEDIEVVQVYSRSELGSVSDEMNNRCIHDLQSLTTADIYIIAVSDDAIAEVSKQFPFTDRLVVHTSGSMPMEVIERTNKAGVFYPLQSFSKEKEVDFQQIPLCIEAENEEDLKVLEKLGRAISPKVFHINSAQRKAIHLSAVFVNNFTNHLYHIGSEICKENNIPFEILHPLIEETAKKIQTMNPKEAQTGPARRSDQKTINSQLQQLSNKSQKEIYELMTRSIIALYGREKL